MDNPKESTTNFAVNSQAVTPAEYLSFIATEGLGFHFGQSAEDVVLMRLFNHRVGGFYVDVGAFHPRLYSNTYFLHRYFGWSGINIDASAETVELFNLERPEDINVHVGIGLKAGSATLHKFDRPARNTLSEAAVRRQLDKGDTKQVGTEKVKIAPLRVVLEQNLPKNKKIDLMNIDIEGLDLEALESNDWQRFRPRVVTIEDHSLLEKGMDQSQIYRFMRDTGYRLSSHTFDTSFYIDSGVSVRSLSGTYDKAWREFAKSQFQAEPMVDNRLNSLLELTSDSFSNQLGAKDTEKYSLLTNQIEASNQRKSKHLEELMTTLNELRIKNSEITDQIQTVEQRYDEAVHSLGWRKTQPVREVVNKIRRFRGKL